MRTQQPQLTSEQHAAIHTRDVSIGLSAGAGCGKTFVLTQRFLSHLEPGRHADPLSGIVALTFTERAAREMRDRIRLACQARVEECPAEQVDHWLRIIRRLDSARISTIHAFCASLLRTHAVEAGIDPQFGLLDRPGSDALLRNAVTGALRRLLSSQDDACMQLVLSYGLERVGEQLRILVREWLRMESDRFEHTTAKELAEIWRDAWQHRFLPELLEYWSHSEPVGHLLRLLQSHTPSNAEMARRCEALTSGIPQVQHSAEPHQRLQELRGDCQVKGGGGKSVWDDEETYQAVRNAMTQVRKSIDNLLSTIDLDQSAIPEASRLGLMALAVTREAALQYESDKADAGMLDFDDLLLQARKLLRNSLSVRRRAAAGIDFLMVDEFQDTDPVQADIIRLLCGDDWSRGKLFFVGDVKQSIYRFRRADPRVFKNSRDELQERGRLPLSTNFRSQRDILRFVNCLFAESIGPGYEPLRPSADEQLSPTPVVEFLFPTPETEDQKESAGSRRRREAESIAQRIATLLSDGVARVRSEVGQAGDPRLREARPGDVCILFRTLSNVAMYEEALRTAGLEYYLVGGRAFYAQQEVYDLINLCRFLDDPTDEISLAGVLRSPFFSFSDDTLFSLCDTHKTLIAGLFSAEPPELPDRQQRQLQHASAVLAELRNMKDRVPLAEILQRAISRTGYDAALLLEFLGSRKLANLRKLVEKAREFDRVGLFTLKDFVGLLSDSVAQQTDEELAATHPETSNVVRLMTIHQAKGLEFPIVFVADMDWNKQGGSPIAQFDPVLGPVLSLPWKRGRRVANPAQTMHRLLESQEDEAETNRLFYVATTRAADYLVLSAGLPANGRVSSPWLRLLSQRFDLETGTPAFDPILGRHVLSATDVPQIRVSQTSTDAPRLGRRPAPLSSKVPQFRERVENSTASAWPQTLNTLQPNHALRRSFSVSEVESAAGNDRANEETPSTASDTHSSGSQLGAELGTVVHNVLERVDPAAPESVHELLEQRLERESKHTTASLQAEAAAYLQAWAQSDIPGELLHARQLFREVDFVLRWPCPDRPAVNIVGQIDCLLETNQGEWRILDYKTGRSTPDSAVIQRRYEIQLCLYALAAAEALGRLPMRVEVVHLAQTAERHRFDMDEATLNDVRQRVDAAIGRLQRGE